MIRRAAALPTVLFVLALTAALAAGGAYVSRGSATGARSLQRGAESGYPAERALVDMMASWDSSAMAGLVIGSTAPAAAIVDGSVRVECWITRLTASSYWLVAEASNPGRPSLRRRTGLLVTIRTGQPHAAPERAWSQLP
jgi:hypothetical protein